MPNTIAENLQRLQNARTAISTAITNKGGTVPTGAGFEDFPTAINTISDWYRIQSMVRAGTIGDILKVRDTLLVRRGGDLLTFEVLDIDADTPEDTQYTHALTLGLRDCYAEWQFDNKEAMFAFAEGLAAGTYHFTIGVQPWYAADVNKTIQFTLTSDVPAGGQLVVSNAYNATMIGTTISVFASSTATTATETVTISEGSEGTDLGTLTEAVSGNLNSIHRGLLGSNNYAQSALRQLINSDKAAGSVWTPQSKFDRPPSRATTTAGFLHGMDPDFVAVLGRVNKRTALNTVSDGGGYTDSVEKVFLLSQTEVYAGLNNSVNEGGPYRYFSEFSDLSAAGVGADTNRIKYRNGAAKYWWLRSPNTGYASNVRLVHTSGTLYYSGSDNAFGVAPACCIV